MTSVGNFPGKLELDGGYVRFGSMRDHDFLVAVQRGGPSIPTLTAVPPPSELMELRAAHALTLSQLSVILGISVDRLSAWEAGSVIPGADGDVTYKRVYGAMRALLDAGLPDGTTFHS